MTPHVHFGRLIAPEPFVSPDTGTYYDWCVSRYCTVQSVTIITDGPTQTRLPV
jgi:hypothetical protein